MKADKDNISLGGREVDAVRPGWSSTRGIAILDDGDHVTEFNPNSQEIDPNSLDPRDLVARRPCDTMSDNMEELTNSWMTNKEGLEDRLGSMDAEAWASSAHTASRSELREFMSDLIADETDKYYDE